MKRKPCVLVSSRKRRIFSTSNFNEEDKTNSRYFLSRYLSSHFVSKRNRVKFRCFSCPFFPTLFTSMHSYADPSFSTIRMKKKKEKKESDRWKGIGFICAICRRIDSKLIKGKIILTISRYALRTESLTPGNLIEVTLKYFHNLLIFDI